MIKINKILTIILLMVIAISYTHPVFGVSNTGSGEWVAGQYDSGIKTTDSKSNTGVIIRRLTNNTTKEKITVFCAEYGVDFSTGKIETAQHIVPTDPLMKTACKIAYFGWYSRYGEYAVDGGILTEGFKQVKIDYVFTQQMIWEILGQSNATFIDSNIQNQYILFKDQINSNINNIQKKPSFCNTTITLNVGESITLTDTNGVLAEYPTIDKTVEKIRIVHNKGENTITVTVGEDCTLDKYTITEEMMKNLGLIKESSKDNDTTIFFSFRDGVQDQLYSMNYNDPVSMSMNLQINQFGKIELSKLDTEGGLIEGAVFQVNGPDNFSKEITVTSGRITVEKLKQGIYTIKEKIAPDGYLLNTNTYTVEVIANRTTTQAIINEMPTGTITIIKKDSETGNTPQGDAKLENAVYKVYANEDIKFYSKGDLVATRTTNAKGETEDITNLPLGRYLVKEEKAPEGYMLDSKEYDVNLSYKDQHTKIITGSVTSIEKVKKMQVHIYKTGIKDASGLIAGLAGAEFTIKLYADVEKAYQQGYSYAEVWNGSDEYGNTVKVDNNRVEEAKKIAPSYEIITTDDNGDAYTHKKLPYGKYVIKETKAPENYYISEDFTFSITQDESEVEELVKKVKHLYVNNIQMGTYIKLVKKDAETGKIVTLNNATFQIKAVNDIYENGKIKYKKDEIITQKIGNTVYNSFTTNSENLIIPEGSFSNVNDDKGTIITPLMLTAGEYEVIEIKVPYGYLELEDTVKLKIDSIKDYDQNNAGEFIKTVEIKNNKPYGTLIVYKTVQKNENIDKSLIDLSDLSGIQFKLSAKEDIIDFADGKVIYEKGQEVNIYNLDEKGILKVENLPLGIYELQEINTLDGLILDETKYEIMLIQNDNKTKVYTTEINIVNNTTIVEISKITNTDENQLIGAQLCITDENGNVIDTWITTEKTHIIEGLKVGEKYTLTEIMSPFGYEIAQPITFKVTADNGVQLIKMVDRPIIETISITGPDIQTGNEINYILLIGNIIFSLLGIGIAIKLLKESKK